MLHAKFQDHRTSGSGEEDFLRFLPYMGMAEEKMFEIVDGRTDAGSWVSYKLTGKAPVTHS